VIIAALPFFLLLRAVLPQASRTVLAIGAAVSILHAKQAGSLRVRMISWRAVTGS